MKATALISPRNLDERAKDETGTLENNEPEKIASQTHDLAETLKETGSIKPETSAPSDLGELSKKNVTIVQTEDQI